MVLRLRVKAVFIERTMEINKLFQTQFFFVIFYSQGPLYCLTSEFLRIHFIFIKYLRWSSISKLPSQLVNTIAKLQTHLIPYFTQIFHCPCYHCLKNSLVTCMTGIISCRLLHIRRRMWKEHIKWHHWFYVKILFSVVPIT